MRMLGASAFGAAALGRWDEGRKPGEPEVAFSVAVREHDAMLRGLARRLCGNASDADDLVHDAYERALRAWGRYIDQGNLRGWLAAIINNVFLDRCRKLKRTPRSEPIEDVEVATQEPAAPPRWAEVSCAAVAAALADLGPEFRLVYELHSDGHSYDQIAAELGIARATVGTRLLRARRKLKEVLERQLGAES
jgi:RNA polymerase sigma-70 factor, ECF subfamily